MGDIIGYIHKIIGGCQEIDTLLIYTAVVVCLCGFIHLYLYRRTL